MNLPEVTTHVRMNSHAQNQVKTVKKQKLGSYQTVPSSNISFNIFVRFFRKTHEALQSRIWFPFMISYPTLSGETENTKI